MGTLTRTGFSADESDKMVVDSLDYLLLLHVDGQFLSELDDLFGSLDEVAAGGNGYIGMGDIFKTIGLILVIRKLHLLFILDDL